MFRETGNVVTFVNTKTQYLAVYCFSKQANVLKFITLAHLSNLCNTDKNIYIKIFKSQKLYVCTGVFYFGGRGQEKLLFFKPAGLTVVKRAEVCRQDFMGWDQTECVPVFPAPDTFWVGAEADRGVSSDFMWTDSLTNHRDTAALRKCGKNGSGEVKKAARSELSGWEAPK